MGSSVLQPSKSNPHLENAATDSQITINEAREEKFHRQIAASGPERAELSPAA
jgi:hypothetical protein